MNVVDFGDKSEAQTKLGIKTLPKIFIRENDPQVGHVLFLTTPSKVFSTIRS